MTHSSRPPSSRRRWLLLVVPVIQAGCASFPVLGGSRGDQLTAALTDLREGTQVAVAIESVMLAPFRLPEDGSGEPVAETEGRHAADWLEASIATGLADRVCSGGDSCEPAPDQMVVALSRPYSGRRGAFVDARVRGADPAGTGVIRYTRYVRLQMEDTQSGWRVVASVPLWETMG